MSAVYPSDEPDEEENPNDLIDRIIDRIIDASWRGALKWAYVIGFYVACAVAIVLHVF